MKVPVCRMTPGSAIVALICATPPSTASLPRIGSKRSLASMPFWSGMTAVFGPTIGRMAAPAVSTSHSLTQNSTKSTGPMLPAWSVAWIGLRCRSPRGDTSVRPRWRSAARWAPRARKVTSPPALAKAAPNAPPTPPAPITAIRILPLPFPNSARTTRARSLDASAFTATEPESVLRAAAGVKPCSRSCCAKKCARRLAHSGGWSSQQVPGGRSAILAGHRQAIAVAGLEAGFDAGAGAQMLNQPEARSDQQDDQNGGGEVLQNAAALVFILEAAHGINDLRAAPLQAAEPAIEFDDVGSCASRLSLGRCAFSILAHGFCASHLARPPLMFATIAYSAAICRWTGSSRGALRPVRLLK